MFLADCSAVMAIAPSASTVELDVYSANDCFWCPIITDAAVHSQWALCQLTAGMGICAQSPENANESTALNDASI